MAFIHPSAEVDKTAQIADSAEIARGAYVGPHCVSGENVKIGMNAIVECHTDIGGKLKSVITVLLWHFLT